MTQVFIDGSAGTTGLRIRERLSARSDLSLLVLPEELRKDPSARRDALNRADVVFLCLPDDAAREAASMVENPDTVVIDTSTAHRVSPDWIYGMPELPGQRERISSARRIANPGCHATGFILLAAPLVARGIIPASASLSCFSLTGYSGGGKKMIAEYEAAERDPLLDAPRMYGLSQQHKHLPEMRKYAGLESDPVFCPIVAPYYAGMEVVLPLSGEICSASLKDLLEIYAAFYAPAPGMDSSRVPVRVTDAAEGGFLSAGFHAGRDDLSIGVFGAEGRLTAVARFDNLGKGASGAAIQNMNLALGLDETTGLVI